jgi:hypothetical protein
MDLSEVKWRRSRRSADDGSNCVEVASLPGTIAVRDSKDPDGPMLALGRADFGAFLTRVKQH